MNDAAPQASAARLPPDVVRRFAAIVGPEHALTDAAQQLPYLREWRDKYEGCSALVLRPASTGEVARIMALAHELELPVVPQAGNTGLVGGQIPHRGEIVVSVARLNRVRHVDAAGSAMTVEAGVTLANAQAAAERAGRLFPLSLPSEGTCRIGGNLGTNAGGVGVLSYGTARQLVLGLEVVLADGRVWNGLKALKKDNTGYDLKDLFIGSEGTLGIITAAVLKLFPLPAETATAFVGVGRIEDALALFSLAGDHVGPALTAFEFIQRLPLEVVLAHVPGTRDPFPTSYPWYVLMEISGLKADGTAARLLEHIFGQAAQRELILDGVVAQSMGQARDFWRLRESVSEAQKHVGGVIKHDISVPVARIPEFIARANALVTGLVPGARPLAIGHLGDGNIHYNVAQPPGMEKQAFLAQWDTLMEAVHALAVSMDGSISAEHGIGVMKRAELKRFKSEVEIDLMQRIKAALDPKGILNPGKVV